MDPYTVLSNQMILAINTSTTQFGLALMKGEGTVLAEYLISPGSKNFNGFMPAVHSLLSSCNVEILDLKAVVVAIGPGSFTGLRVGVSGAKGIAHGLKIPIIGISSLEAMANQIPYANYPLCVMMSARKGEVFIALFHWDDEKMMIRVTEDTSMKLKELARIIDRPTLFLGNDFKSQGDPIKETLGGKAFLAPSYLWNLRASAVGTSGLKRFLDHDFDDIRDLVPCYLSTPDIRPGPISHVPDKGVDKR